MKQFNKIYLELSNNCNLSCPFCASEKEPPRALTIRQLEQIIPQVAMFTDEVRPHLLGEPLIYEHLREFIDLCKKNLLTVKITTNGTLLEGNISSIIQSDAVKEVNISLHSFDGTSADESAIYLKKIIEYADSSEDRAPHQYINFRFWTLKGGNISEKDLNLLKGVLARYGREIPCEGHLPKTFKLADKRFLRFDEEFIWPSITLPYRSDRGFCYGAKSHIGIRSDGIVVPCCLDAKGETNLGNIFTETFEHILQGERFKSIVDGFKSGIRVEDLCKRCSYMERFTRSDN